MRYSLSGVLRAGFITLLLALFPGYAQTYRLNFDLYPWHTKVEVQGLSDPSFDKVFEASGPALSVLLPEGRYRYKAYAEDFISVKRVINVPENKNLLINLNPTFLATLAAVSGFTGSVGDWLMSIIAVGLLGFLVYAPLYLFLKYLLSKISIRFLDRRLGLFRPSKFLLSAHSRLAAHGRGVLLCAALFGISIVAFHLFPTRRNLFMGLSLFFTGGGFYHLVSYLYALPEATKTRRYQAVWQEIFNLLPPNWRYEELGGEGSLLWFQSAAKHNYVLSIVFGKGEVSREGEQLRVSTDVLANEINFHHGQLVRMAENHRAKAIMYLPAASSPEWKNWVSVKPVIYFYGGARALVEWFDLRDQLELEREELKRRGREVEEDAQQAVEQFIPSGWKFLFNYILDHGGDADIILTLPAEKRVVIDVKSYEGAIGVRRFSLIREDGKRWDEVVEQVKRQARELRAVPVIWQPAASKPHLIKFRGVHFIAGDVQKLFRELADLTGLSNKAGSRKAIWRSKEYDHEVQVTGFIGEHKGRRYLSIEGSQTGIPEDETEFVD